MSRMRFKNEKTTIETTINDVGFTVVEVIVAASIMIILCVGILSVFSFVVKINQGNNLRSQALTVLQAEAENYRSVKFVPSLTDNILLAGNTGTSTSTKTSNPSANGTLFTVTTTVKNLNGTSDTDCTFKEIKIDVAPINAQPGWLANLNTTLTFQRVRAN